MFSLLSITVFCFCCGQKELENQKIERENGSYVIDLLEGEKLVDFGLGDAGKSFVVHKKRQIGEQPEEDTVDKLVGAGHLVKKSYVIREH
ncbi:hypothetical protein ACTNDZ_12105 [Selenomonas montiformis]|uniref:hypothetical protein n=1 Tax=Selenomonas montiformis TaxID=2652285 RepID=UPI003F8B470B